MYQALDTSLQRYVAVKLLRGQHMSPPDERDVETLMREAVSQARVEHPNIVTIYYVGKQDGDPFFAMELVNGVSIGEKIQEGNLSFSDISNVAHQIAEALKFSYGLDIIHGDIKPPNILIQQNGVAKLSDFGMARRVSGSKKERIGGTPNYLAPELLDGGKPSIQSDMYAFGVTLYEMTFGRLPIHLTGSTIDQWRSDHSNAAISFPTPWPDRFPDEWQDTLQKLLARDPEDRFESYDELLEDLEKTKSREIVLAKPVPRMIAALFDWMLVFMLMMPCQVLLATPEFYGFFDSHPLMMFVVQAVDLLPIVTYTAILYFWRQSIGRQIMQLRVINKYGFNASKRKLLFRSFLRMILPWSTSLLFFITRTSLGWMQDLASGISLLVTIFVVVSGCFLIFNRQHRSLHDIVFDTRVIIDR